MHQPSDQCRPARCQHESRGQGRHWSGVRRSTAAPATPARRLLRSESRRSSSPRHSSWSLSFSAEIFSAAWRAPMSSNMERVAAMPDASLYVNRDGRRADDCVDSHGGGNLIKIPRFRWRDPSIPTRWEREGGNLQIFHLKMANGANSQPRSLAKMTPHSGYERRTVATAAPPKSCAISELRTPRRHVHLRKRLSHQESSPGGPPEEAFSSRGLSRRPELHRFWVSPTSSQ